jgi:hypothetical protein
MTRSQAAARVRPAPHRPAASRPPGALATERRRRERHYRLRRRDLLGDVGAGLLVTVLLLVLTAGLGVLALLDLALLGLLVASAVVERRRSRRANRDALHQRREPAQRPAGGNAWPSSSDASIPRVFEPIRRRHR